MEIFLQFTYPYFYGPEFLCKFIHYLQAVPMYASPFLLITISIDRYQVFLNYLIVCINLINFLLLFFLISL